MKKFIALMLTLLLTVALGVTAFAAPNGARVFDNGGILSNDDETQIQSAIESFANTTGLDFVVLVSESKGGKSLREYSDDFYDQGGFGIGDDKSGILLLIDMEERTVYISTCGKAIEYMTDQRIDSIVGDDGDRFFWDYLIDGEYKNAVLRAIDICGQYYEKGIPSDQNTYVEDGMDSVGVVKRRSLSLFKILLSVIVGMVPAISFAAGINSSYKMKKARSNAAALLMAYRAVSAYAFANVADDLISHNVTRRRIIKSTPQGSPSGRSTIHMSGGGTFHGGGGGGRHF